MMDNLIIVSKEMKEALQYVLSDTRSPKIMFDYLIFRFQDQAMKEGSWDCLYTSKNYKDIIRNYEVLEMFYGCMGEFIDDLNSRLKEETSKDWGFEE